MDIIKSIEHEQLKNKVPVLTVGNTVKVNKKVKKETKEKEKTSRETLGKYFYDLSKLSFGAMVLKDDYINIIVRSDNDIYDYGLNVKENEDFDMSKFVSIEKIKKVAYKAFDENWDKMGVSSLIGEREYYLAYEDGEIYYSFNLGKSYVNVNVQTGKIIDEYYDSGMIIN